MSTQKEKRLAEKETRTTKISELIRYMSFGIVALTYSIFTSNAAFAVTLLTTYKSYFLWASFFSGLAIAFDYLQFVAGYIAVKYALNQDDYKYDDDWYSYKVIKIMFILKQITAGIGVSIVCAAMFEIATA